MNPSASPAPRFSGERFRVLYYLQGNETEARAKALDICVEETVEFPLDLLPEGDTREHLVGRIEELAPLDGGGYRAVISYAVESSGFWLSQLLNVAFGNISMKPGIRLERLDLPESLLRAFRGPRFGRDGLRAHIGAGRRPLLCAVLKMMGATPQELAQEAYDFALGGADLIKDDHCFGDLPFAPFTERAARVAEAVQRANAQTGYNCVYLANILTPADWVVESAYYAKEVGAGGLLVCFGFLGLDMLRRLAADDALGLPVMSHPTFQGTLGITPTQGLSYYALFGQIMRLAGADAIAYPNYGGRFAYTREDCREIVAGTEGPLGSLKPIFPAPGGGLKAERIPELQALYGPEVILMVGGDLHRRSPDRVQNCRYFREMLERAEDTT